MRKIVGLGIAAALLTLSVSIVIATHFPGSIYVKHYPKNIHHAELAGYIIEEECVPGMGIHALKLMIVDGVPVLEQPILLYNHHGKLIGIELLTKLYPDDSGVLLEDFGIDLGDPDSWPVPVPPWDGPMGPHPGMPPDTLHWDLHIYFRNPIHACD